MTKIMFIPVDERPCSYMYAQRLVEGNNYVEMLVPPKEILGNKKVPADVDKLWEWINRGINGCDYMVASIDMLIYGGIVPSRLHYLTVEQCEELFYRLSVLKKNHPTLIIYSFNLIMRVPSYSSNDEEPDYYGIYGERIYKYSWLSDKIVRREASTEDFQQFEIVKNDIPEDILQDFTGRRRVNSYVNSRAVELANDGVLDFLVLPLDDCSEYGFSVFEQHKILKYVDEHTLHEIIYLYPGADEVGCSLTARVLNSVNGKKTRFFVRYSSTAGPNIIPICEDRPLGESIKSQIMVAGGIPVDNSSDADIVLMVNSPTQSAENMGDARIPKDPSSYSMKNLREFSTAIQYYVEQNKRVALGDVAFCNGSDDELMRLLGKKGLLPKLYSYAGWNTSGNTLGTAISHAVARYNSPSTVQENKFLAERFVEDWGYQAIVRQILSNETEQGFLNINDNPERVKEAAEQYLNKFIDEFIPEYREKYCVKDVYFPWKRLFEVGFTLYEK